MSKPFIRNHQYNVIKKQAGILQNALRAISDPKVLESVRYSTVSKILELFPYVTDIQKTLFERVSALETEDDIQKYLGALEPYLEDFPQVTEKQLQKLFPKNKKLKMPDLSLIDNRYVTYLSWIDISTNKSFLVHHLNGQFMGIEGKFTPINKKSYCFLCNGLRELAFYSVVCKKPANSSPDYYKTVGNYMCMDSHECNKNITDITPLEKFIDTVIK